MKTKQQVSRANDMEYGSAANGMQVGSGYDVVVKRESDTTALVNVTNLATKEEWLCETEVEADTDMQKLACQIGQCPSAELGGMPSDEDWDFCCDRWNAIKLQKERKIMRTNEPFGPEYIFRLASNDGSTHDAIQRHLSGIISAVGLACDMAAGENKAWHDDPSADDYAAFHAPSDAQFPPEDRLLAAAELFLYYMRERAAGQKIADRLQLAGSGVAA